MRPNSCRIAAPPWAEQPPARGGRTWLSSSLARPAAPAALIPALHLPSAPASLCTPHLHQRARADGVRDDAPVAPDGGERGHKRVVLLGRPRVAPLGTAPRVGGQVHGDG